MILKTADRAFKRPEDANLISKLGDLTSFYSLIQIREKMKDSEIGQKILADQPRIKDFDFGPG